MHSLISGFEYDIFISYRQKDNKYDGWVSKFVDNLKGELESTFKEEISVYFDINPHDRLAPTLLANCNSGFCILKFTTPADKHHLQVFQRAQAWFSTIYLDLNATPHYGIKKISHPGE